MLRSGELIADHRLTPLSGAPVPVPDPDRVVHLQFRRFAGCPICNLHLQTVVRRHDEITAAGIREVVVFHSTAEDLRKHEPDLPFAVIPDPDKTLYREFGVESRLRAVLAPRMAAVVPRSVWHAVRGVVTRRRAAPPLAPKGGQLGLPADFLINRDGRLLAAKYGQHADDQWSVDELLSHLPG